MFKYHSLKVGVRARSIFNWFGLFTAVSFGLALTAIYPFFSEGAFGELGSVLNPQIYASAAIETGTLEICKQASGSGLENRIFKFKVGEAFVEVPIGQC